MAGFDGRGQAEGGDGFDVVDGDVGSDVAHGSLSNGPGPSVGANHEELLFRCPPPSLAEVSYAKLVAGFFHVGFGGGAAEAVEGGHAEGEFLHPIAGEDAFFGFFEDIADGVFVDHAGAAGAHSELAGARAPFGEVFFDADFVHDVDHRPEGADGFGVGEAGRIAVFNHYIEAGAHQVDRPAVQDLLFKVVPFGFHAGRSDFDHAGAS